MKSLSTPRTEETVRPFVRPAHLAESVAEYLREEIVSGRLSAGQRLIEQEIASTLGVSRVPVREAFRILASERFILLSIHRGATVSQVSEQELNNLFSVRIALEALGAKEAATRDCREELEAMKRLNVVMKECVVQGDEAGYSKANIQFHETLIRAAGNPKLAEVYEFVRGQFRRYQRVLSRRRDYEHAIKTHSAIVRAIQSGEPDKAAIAIARHLQSAAELLATTPGAAGDIHNAKSD